MNRKRLLATADHDELRAADGLVVPGVDSFPEAMRRLLAFDFTNVDKDGCSRARRCSTGADQGRLRRRRAYSAE